MTLLQYPVHATDYIKIKIKGLSFNWWLIMVYFDDQEVLYDLLHENSLINTKKNMLKDIIPCAVQGSRYRFWWPRGSGKADKAL